MTNLYKNIFWAVLTLIAASIIFSFVFQSSSAPAKLSLSDLVAKINAGEVAQVTVRGDELAVTLKNGARAQSRKETEAGASETLHNLGVGDEALRNAGFSIESQSGFQYWAGILIPNLLPLLFFVFIFWMMFRQAKVGVNQAFNFGRANIRLSNFSREKVMFTDVAGLKEAKEELVEVVDFLKNPKKFLDLGARIPRGVLLVGPPGTGKTLLARAAAGESNVPFFNVSASEFVEMFAGVGASRIRDAFLTARRAAPAILFIDEIDAVGRQRGPGFSPGNEEREQTLNQILVELDGFDRETNVIVLAATNRPDILDAALLRPGRFDRRVVLDLPDINDREAILKIHSRGKTFDGNVDFRKIAVRTPGFSGADLANLMNEAAILAGRANKKTISQQDMYESVEKVILGPERKSRAITVKEKEITAYHEAGHALVAASLKDADPVHKVTIISRGFAGGYTMKLPIEERHLRTRNQFLSDLATMLGGFASEQLLFKDVSTGAANDLKVASETARRLVMQYGMSDLGPLTFGRREETTYGYDVMTEKNYSEKTAERIDEEVNKFISRAREAAEKIIKSRKKALDALAARLIEKETIEQDEFQEILKPFKIKPVSVS